MKFLTAEQKNDLKKRGWHLFDQAEGDLVWFGDDWKRLPPALLEITAREGLEVGLWEGGGADFLVVAYRGLLKGEGEDSD